MEDNVTEVERDEVSSRESSGIDLRSTLRQQLQDKSETEVKPEPTQETEYESQSPTESEEQAPIATPEPERPLLVAPADMNAVEKDAFLNPTPANAHILQQYLNRRAYETKTQYDRRMQEVNQLREQTKSYYDAIKQYEDEYAKAGISITDVTKRAIAWDKAMQANPVETAREWLESYGLTIDELAQAPQQQQQANYLTREEAEKLAEERYRALQGEQEKKALEYYNQQIVNSFMSGKPLFRDPETASQLEAEMAPVVQALNSTGRYSSAQEVLETAYNYVVNGNPTFSRLQSKITAGQVVQQQQATTQKAKQAAKSITGSAGSGTPRIQVKDIRDNLAKRFSGE